MQIFARLLSYLYFFIMRQPLEDQGLLSTQATQSHSDTTRSVRLLYSSNLSVTETSTNNTTLKRKRRPCPRRDSKRQSHTHALDRAATGIGVVCIYYQHTKVTEVAYSSAYLTMLQDLELRVALVARVAHSSNIRVSPLLLRNVIY
jgi:hypothetical protein